MAKKLRIDWFLFAIATVLALFGAVMVYSASAMIALKETEGASQFTYFYKQLGFTGAGLVAMFIISRIDYRLYNHKMFVYGLVVLTVLLLVMTLAFPPINGARRWIRMPGISLQPSEFTKIVLPLFLAYFLTKHESKVGDLKATVLPCLAVLGVMAGLIMLEPDLGTTIVISAVFIVVYFAAGANLFHIATVAAGLILAGVAALIFAPWRMARFMAFLNPWENADSSAYQVTQGLMAIGSGGILGEGFAKGQQKLFYLPYPYSDFIYAVVGEELGLVGTMAVLIAFGFLLWRGTRAALLAPDRFGMLLGIGITTGLIVQALFNISVVLSLLPAKGIPLPFISYGGSSILVTLAAVGILLNISQYAGFVSRASDADEDIPRRKRRRVSRAGAAAL